MVIIRMTKKVFIYLICIISAIPILILLIQNFEQKESITSISSSYYNTCYTTAEGNLYAMGINSDGQIGDSSDFFTDKPQKINIPHKVKSAVVSLNSLAYINENGDTCRSRRDAGKPP